MWGELGGERVLRDKTSDAQYTIYVLISIGALMPHALILDLVSQKSKNGSSRTALLKKTSQMPNLGRTLRK
jgi:hypothetical protein